MPLNEKCKRLLTILETIRGETAPVGYHEHPESINELWQAAENVIYAIAHDLETDFLHKKSLVV